MNLASKVTNRPLLELIGKSGEELGLPTYAVGGYVRDLLLKRPSKDIDVVCVGSGIALAKQVANNYEGKAHVQTFKNFGTAMVKMGDWEVEFVGARKESYDRNSRKPAVEDGTLEDDQNRRDFTINAMAIDLSSAHFGYLVDPFDGVKDLKRKIIRTPLEPEVTFSDDPLRMMRAVRFAAQLDFDIAPNAFDAIMHQADRLEIISMERIMDEVNKIILCPKPSYGFKLLEVSGLLKQFFPEMVALKGVETINGKSHKDNFYHTLQVLDNICETTDDLWARWSAILHDIAKPPTKRFHPQHGWTFHGHEDKGARMTPKIFRRLKLPMNEKMKKVQKLVRLHLRPIALVKDTITDSAIRRLLFEAGDEIDDLMKLCRADITSKNDSKVKRYIANFDRLEKRMAEIEESDKLRNFQPVITGEMIMETFGIPPSKAVGDIKTEIRESILEGRIKNEFRPAYSLMLALGIKAGLEVKNKQKEWSYWERKMKKKEAEEV